MKTLYYNGNIITMANYPMPEAVLCENGKIIAMGEKDKLISRDVKLFDLEGKTMLPAFLDAHSHITSYANSMATCNLSEAKSIDEIVELLEKFKNNKKLEKDDFILGFGYDHNNFQNKKHPTKEDLEKVTTEYPIMIAHASGHMGVCNTKALKFFGINEDTPNPKGGIYGRDKNGKLTGYLEETAFTSVATKAKAPDYNDMCEYFRITQNEYFKYGITTIQDGFTGDKEWALLKKLSDDKKIKADVVCYIDINHCQNILRNNLDYNKEYINNLKIGGYKLFLDGSPQGRTAWMLEPYEGEKEYRGYPIYNDEQVTDYIVTALKDKQQLICHCNGDAAAQQFIESYEKADEILNTKENYRPVIIHGQLTTEEQMPQIKRLDMIISFFVGHTWQWGDVHLENFGERAMKISAVNSAIKNDIITTFHQDSPVLPPDMIKTIWCAVNRKTKNGVQLDLSEAVTVYDAIKSVTINAAYQYGEENRKGSIEPGKDASFVILNENPLLYPKEKLNELKVEYTILRDEMVYKR